MSELFKYVYERCIDPLELPLEWYYEYFILAIIGVISYRAAYKKVGTLYNAGFINGRTSGSFFHWMIRTIFFVALWAVTNGAINLYYYIHNFFQ